MGTYRRSRARANWRRAFRAIYPLVRRRIRGRRSRLAVARRLTREFMAQQFYAPPSESNPAGGIGYRAARQSYNRARYRYYHRRRSA